MSGESHSGSTSAALLIALTASRNPRWHSGGSKMNFLLAAGCPIEVHPYGLHSETRAS